MVIGVEELPSGPELRPTPVGAAVQTPFRYPHAKGIDFTTAACFLLDWRVTRNKKAIRLASQFGLSDICNASLETLFD